jgi:hypothetical protein
MAGFASEFGTKAAGQWGKLENIFEERVARALEKLGLPSAADYAALQARVAALEAELQRSEKKPAAAPARASRKTAGRSAAPAAAPKKTVRRSTKAG